MDAERTAADAFRLLSDETRLDILRAVARAQHGERRTGVAELSFSAIYERVDVDNTSKLSYHLGELTGTFLRKHEEGYSFTHAGEGLVRFVLAENYHQPTDFGTVETTGVCLHCGEASLRASLEDQYFLIRCSACSRPAFSYRVTPALVNSRDDRDLIDTVNWEQAGDFRKVRKGVCPDCAGRLATEVLDTSEEAVADGVPVSFGTISECQECLRFLSVPLTHAAAHHPEAIAFFWDHGVDARGTGLREFHGHLHDGRWTADRVDTDPAEYRVVFRRDAASLRRYLDAKAAVTRAERVRTKDLRDRQT